MVETRHIHVITKGEDDLVDLTPMLAEELLKAKVRNGTATLFVIGSTGALTTIEYEPGLAHDFPAALERIAHRDATYQHEERWGDDNGHSHVRASLVGPSLTIPVLDGKATLGVWQQVILLECDTRPRERTIVVQLLGE